LSALFDWLVAKQQATIDNSAKACKAKVSLIAHSMGNYVVQKTMAAAWTRKNQPLLVSLINQLVMVAADVDSDLFDEGAPDNNDGNAIANFTYRITALYSGRDSVLGASAGLKHFGMRRLGRSGLPNYPPLADASSPTDNVWDVDCSSFFSRTSPAQEFTELISSTTTRSILCDTFCAVSTAMCLTPLDIPKALPGRERDECNQTASPTLSTGPPAHR